MIEKSLQVHPAQIDAVLGGLSAEDQVDLHRLLVKLNDHLETLSHDEAGKPG